MPELFCCIRWKCLRECRAPLHSDELAFGAELMRKSRILSDCPFVRSEKLLMDEHQGGLVVYDNAAMESWNHSLKVEAIHGERFATREQAKAHVFEYIEVDYNRIRLHSTLGYLSPEQFELAHAA